jgi:hypothetical protein
MCDIVTSRDLLCKLEAGHAEFKSNPDSARHALNCIITAYHLHEWVWGDWLKTDYDAMCKLGIRSQLSSFAEWLERQWLDFGIVRDLTNGAKHFNRSTKLETQRVAGYGIGPFGVGPYGRPYLLIDRGAQKSDRARWRTADELIDEAVGFWRSFFDSHRPLPKP